MATTTPNYGFSLPAVNSATDEDLWGTELNSNTSSLDTILAAKLSSASPTWTGTGTGASITVSSAALGTATASSIALSGGAVLSNYTTGTFTPVIVGLTLAGTGTYSAQAGSYTRIGNAVIITIALTWTGHTGTGSMAIRTLPFSGVTSGLPIVLYNSGIASAANSYIIGVTSGQDVQIHNIVIATGSVTPVAVDAAGTINALFTYLV